MSESALGEATRVLCYAIDQHGRSGDLLAVGSLLLPYFTTFHPDLTVDQPFAELRAMIAGRASGDVRVRLVVVGRRNETVDATLFFGGDLEDGGGWYASAVLDRPSDQPCHRLPHVDSDEASAAVLHRLFDEFPLRVEAADRARRRPGRPRALTTTRRPQATRTDVPWPPAGAEDFHWVPERPDWLPPLIPFPPLEIDIVVLRVHCPILCIKWWCTC